MTEEKDSEVVPCKWYSEVIRYLFSCKKYVENIYKENTINEIVF